MDGIKYSPVSFIGIKAALLDYLRDTMFAVKSITDNSNTGNGSLTVFSWAGGAYNINAGTPTYPQMHIKKGTVQVVTGAVTLTETSAGSGILASSNGLNTGTVNYQTGAITIKLAAAPANAAAITLTYQAGLGKISIEKAATAEGHLGGNKLRLIVSDLNQTTFHRLTISMDSIPNVNQFNDLSTADAFTGV